MEKSWYVGRSASVQLSSTLDEHRTVLEDAKAIDSSEETRVLVDRTLHLLSIRPSATFSFSFAS